MTLVINGRFLTRAKTGVDRVAENIVLGLDRIWPESSAGRYVLAVPRGEYDLPVLARGDILSFGKRNGALWEQLELSQQFPTAVIFNPCNTAPILHNRNIVVIHDANVFDFPASYSAQFRAWYRFLLPLIARRAARVVTVSHHSARRLVTNRITRTMPCVIPNGCDHFEPLPAAAPARKKNMILFAGSPAPHKNLDLFSRLAKRFETRGVEFVVAGSASSAVFSSFARGQGSHPPNLRFLGRVSDTELVTAYLEASVLLFPSFVEGFGLTPIEAQSFGCPVISSDRQPMPEILGDSVLYADPSDIAAWEFETGRVLSNPDLAETLSTAGRANSARFTWASASEKYLEMILSELSVHRTGA